jgi:transcriptional regulator with XRE-family HTH domain
MLCVLGRRPVQSFQSERHDALTRLLREYRENAGISQEKLAKKLGWTQSQISHVEGGSRRLDVLELMDFADAAGFDFAVFVEDLRGRIHRS